MEVSFGPKTTAVIDVQTVVTPVEGVKSYCVNTAVPAAEPKPVMVSVPATVGNSDGGFIMGNSLPGFKDIILPRLNIVQSLGLLKDSFPQGAIVFGQTLVLFTLPIIDKQTGNVKMPALPPVWMTVLGFRPTRFVEKIAGGIRGLVVNTEAEVRSAGGTLDYNEWKLKEKDGMKRFETLAEAFVVIKRPAHVADDNSVFLYDIGGEKYTLALWAMKGTAYTHAAKRVFFTARKMGCLQKGGYPSWSYNVTTRSETMNNNTYYVPVCIPNVASTAAFLDFTRGLLNGAPAQPAESTE
jgi:hypothetical protein